MSRFSFRPRMGSAGNVRLPRAQKAFFERLGALDDVRLEPGINQDEFFDDQFERRAREIQRTPSASGGVASIPSKKGPWTGNNQLGIERGFAPDENNRQTILKLDEWDFPEVWSVMLGIEYTNPSVLVGGNGFSIVANVFAGVGGATQEFEVDWQSGMTFQCVMNAVNIVAEYDEIDDIPDDIRLRVTIGKKRLTGARPTRSFRSINAGPRIEIPAFTRSIRFTDRFALASGPFTSVFAATASVNLYTAAPAAPSIQVVPGTTLLSLGGAIPIPNGARFFDVQNSAVGPGSTILYNAICELGL